MQSNSKSGNNEMTNSQNKASKASSEKKDNAKDDKKSILGHADSGTHNGHADQPMAGSLGKKGKGEADMEAAAGNTDE